MYQPVKLTWLWNNTEKPLACGLWFLLSFEHFAIILEYRPWKIVVYLLSYRSEQMNELTILFNRFKIEHYNRTYPNIEFNILVGHCLHIKTYSWYGCDWLSKFKLVQYSCLVLRVNKYFFVNSMNINATKCNKEHCKNLFTVIAKSQILLIKNMGS